MSSNPINLVVSPQTPTNGNLIDPKTGQLTWGWLKFFMDLAQAVNNALTILGQFNGIIGTAATVQNRTGTLAEAVQHVDAVGVVQSPGIVPASDVASGAVVLPPGAVSNILGTAALENTTVFDPAGAAATAQTNAEAFATAGDTSTLAAAEAYSSNASHLTSGTVPNARLGGVSGTINLDKLTPITGSNGSITVTNGIITAFVNPT